MSEKIENKDGLQVTPFLKWAGGKRWLASKHSNIFPKSFNNYIEPFLGSGAIFFHLKPKCGVLSDVNSELINAYNAIKSDWQKVQASLKEHNRNHNDDYYYEERGRQRTKNHTKAGQLIYLNRTCWNGLYRVNLKGEFNVPRGTKDSVCLPNDNFEEISRLLQNVKIKVSDFEPIVDSAGAGDFIFIDPPYTVKHNKNGFVKYNESIFSWDDQVRLRDAVERASKRGALVTITNANHASIRDIYQNFSCVELSRHSVLAGKASARNATTELLVRNWA